MLIQIFYLLGGQGFGENQYYKKLSQYQKKFQFLRSKIKVLSSLNNLQQLEDYKQTEIRYKSQVRNYCILARQFQMSTYLFQLQFSCQLVTQYWPILYIISIYMYMYIYIYIICIMFVSVRTEVRMCYILLLISDVFPFSNSLHHQNSFVINYSCNGNFITRLAFLSLSALYILVFHAVDEVGKIQGVKSAGRLIQYFLIQ